jgi:hypothetical protein
MNVSSVGSPAQYMNSVDSSDGVSGSVAEKVLSQVKQDGEEALDLIHSAAPQGSTGQNLNVYA